MYRKLKQLSSKIISIIISPNLWLWFAPLIYIVPNIILTFTETYSFFSKIVNLTLPLGIYLLLFSISRKVGRTLLLFIPLIAFFIFQLVLLSLYGESIIAIDMYGNLVTTNAGEAGELLSNLTFPIVFAVLLYLPSIIIGLYLCIKKRFANIRRLKTERKVSFIVLAVALISLICSFFFRNDYHPRREIFPYNVLENIITAVRRAHESSNYENTSSTYSYHPISLNDSIKPKIIVLVIGESSRAGNWQILGYERETNPHLSKRNDLIVFSKVLTESNTTHKAVPLLLSDLTPQTFGDSLIHKKSVFSLFNDLGYLTAFFSAQQPNHSYIDKFAAQSDVLRFVSSDDDLFDTRLLAPLSDFLSDTISTQKFIALHTYGSHFAYNARYPKEEAVFIPDKDSRAKRENQNNLINAYDNATRRVDLLLDSIIGILDKTGMPAVMVYVSDHADDIFDDRRGRFLHSSPTPTYYQLHVPMLVWMSANYKSEYSDKYTAVVKNKDIDVASTTSVFHTLVDLADATFPGFRPDYSVANQSYMPEKRYYLNDYNEGIPLKKSGLQEIDFFVLENKNISF